MANAERFTQTNRLLVKLRPSNRLRAAESRANLRPLYGDSPRKDGSLGLGSAPGWFLADMPEGAENPWDLAHSHLAARLGVGDSDVIFAEPDMIQTVYEQKEERGTPLRSVKDARQHPRTGLTGSRQARMFLPGTWLTISLSSAEHGRR